MPTLSVGQFIGRPELHNSLPIQHLFSADFGHLNSPHEARKMVLHDNRCKRESKHHAES